MWNYVLWGLVGAATNRGLLFLEATQQAKGWPWARPDGPGGGVYATSIVIHLGIAAGATAALAHGAVITNSLVAFGVGVGAPAVVKKFAGYAETIGPMISKPIAREDEGQPKPKEAGTDGEA